MRHNKKINHLGRQAAHRKALLSNLASSLILHKRIETTVAKAKALRMYVEPLITKSKQDTTHSRRVVFSYLKSKEAVAELFREVAPKIADRPGGYCRILKTGFRLGDAAEMCLIELVDFNLHEGGEGRREAQNSPQPLGCEEECRCRRDRSCRRNRRCGAGGRSGRAEGSGQKGRCQEKRRRARRNGRARRRAIRRIICVLHGNILPLGSFCELPFFIVFLNVAGERRAFRTDRPPARKRRYRKKRT